MATTKYRTDNYPYKVYTALLTQTGTNAPIATVLENTLGVNITYARQNSGYYQINASSNIFIEVKTAIIVGNSSNTTFNQYACIWNSDSQLVLSTSDGASIRMDEILYQTFIEIRVYN
jgi:hypothetical protein